MSIDCRYNDVILIKQETFDFSNNMNNVYNLYERY